MATYKVYIDHFMFTVELTPAEVVALENDGAKVEKED